MARPVAPYMGAWIEITGVDYDVVTGKVAPYMGAWIEMDYFQRRLGCH